MVTELMLELAIKKPTLRRTVTAVLIASEELRRWGLQGWCSCLTSSIMTNMPLARLSALCRRVARLSHDEHVSEEKVVAVGHVRAWKSMPEKLPDTIRDVVGGPESTLLHAKGAGALKFTRVVLSDLQSISSTRSPSDEGGHDVLPRAPPSAVDLP